MGSEGPRTVATVTPSFLPITLGPLDSIPPSRPAEAENASPGASPYLTRNATGRRRNPMPLRGVEPPTLWSEARCSIQLSYSGINPQGDRVVLTKRRYSLAGRCFEHRGADLSAFPPWALGTLNGPGGSRTLNLLFARQAASRSHYGPKVVGGLLPGWFRPTERVLLRIPSASYGQPISPTTAGNIANSLNPGNWHCFYCANGGPTPLSDGEECPNYPCYAFVWPHD